MNPYYAAKPELMLRLFDTIIILILLYGSEVWGLSDIKKYVSTI